MQVQQIMMAMDPKNGMRDALRLIDDVKQVNQASGK